MGGNVVDEIFDSCLLMRSRLIARVVTGIYDQELRPFAINSPQLALLVIISKTGPVSRSEIGRFHNQDRSTLTRNLQIMVAKGWVEEIEDKASGRSRPLGLTKTGKDLLHKAMPAWRAAQKHAKAVLGKNGAGAIMDIAAGIMSHRPTA